MQRKHTHTACDTIGVTAHCGASALAFRQPLAPRHAVTPTVPKALVRHYTEEAAWHGKQRSSGPP